METLKWISGREVNLVDLDGLEEQISCYFSCPVIVIGPPRSGTSTIARILSNYFGIKMGTLFMTTDMRNPGGYYEDIDLVKANDEFMMGKITLPQWSEKMLAFIKKMLELQTPWGFKDPRACIFFGQILSFFDNPTIIRCHRKEGLVIKSLEEYFNFKREQAQQLYFKSEKTLDRVLKGRFHIFLDMTKGRSDLEIVKEMAGSLNNTSN